ncbi:MAG: serine hydrolase [Pseudomonadota bacterium]
MCERSQSFTAWIWALAAALAVGASWGGAGAAASSCAEGDLDRSKIAEAVQWIDENETHIDSFLVQHCDVLVAEQYYNGYAADKRHDLQSATKTFTASLIGIALHEGVLSDIDQPLSEILPDYANLLTGEKSPITLRHLLTMTSGLKWVDFGPERSFDRVDAAPDSVAYILSEPMVSAPGETFFYNTGSSHLLSGVISARTGMAASAYAEEKLFGPLGVSDFTWEAHTDGRSQGGWKLFVRPRDMVKFGRLYLDGGVLGDARLMDAGFVDEATRQQNPASETSGYGYQMWIESDLGIADVAAARGWGGQDIFVLDEYDMVVVFTGDIYKPGEVAAEVKYIMQTFIAPAHKNASAAE